MHMCSAANSNASHIENPRLFQSYNRLLQPSNGQHCNNFVIETLIENFITLLLQGCDPTKLRFVQWSLLLSYYTRLFYLLGGVSNLLDVHYLVE